jgi:hypothetical protein
MTTGPLVVMPVPEFCDLRSEVVDIDAHRRLARPVGVFNDDRRNLVELLGYGVSSQMCQS